MKLLEGKESLKQYSDHELMVLNRSPKRFCLNDWLGFIIDKNQYLLEDSVFK